MSLLFHKWCHFWVYFWGLIFFSLNYSPHFPVYLPNFLCWRSDIVSVPLVSAGFGCVPLKSVSWVEVQLDLCKSSFISLLPLVRGPSVGFLQDWLSLALAASFSCALLSFTSRNLTDCLPSVTQVVVGLTTLWGSFLTSVRCMQACPHMQFDAQKTLMFPM